MQTNVAGYAKILVNRYLLKDFSLTVSELTRKTRLEDLQHLGVTNMWFDFTLDAFLFVLQLLRETRDVGIFLFRRLSPLLSGAYSPAR